MQRRGSSQQSYMFQKECDDQKATKNWKGKKMQKLKTIERKVPE